VEPGVDGGQGGMNSRQIRPKTQEV
jgi:hypothetical protein